MHIHPNNSLLMASLGAGREEAQEIQAKRAAEVRRKLSSASRVPDELVNAFSPAHHIDRRSYEAEPSRSDDDSFGKLFSAKA